MDSTDKAVFGKLMGGTAMWAVECRREMAVEKEGKWVVVVGGDCLCGGCEGKGLP